MPICKLCLEKKEIIKKSHIIPEFLYQGLFDAKHKMFYFKPFKVGTGEDFVKRPSTGEYEGGILCHDCEHRVLGQYESYARNIFYSTQLKAHERLHIEKKRTDEEIFIIQVHNIDYRKFKIFLLSILWRASISSRPFFNSVKLGRHEEVIRKMIYEGNAGAFSDFPIFIATYLHNKTVSSDLISQPRRIEIMNSNTSYVFLISGFFYTFYVAEKENIPPLGLSMTIKPTGKLKILALTTEDTNDILKNFGF